MVVVAIVRMEKISFISFHYNYEQNFWIRKKLRLNQVHTSYTKSFVLNILGQLYFIMPDNETHAYNIKDQVWKVSTTIMDNNILEESQKLTMIRLP